MSKLQKKKKVPAEKKKPKDPGVKSNGGTSAVAAKSASPGPAVKTKQSAGEAGATSASPIARAVEFFREVKVELKKVTWPTRKQTTGTTIVVIVFVFVVAAFLGLFDLGLSRIVRVVLT
jgi:preprotein translocase subunit SecE